MLCAEYEHIDELALEMRHFVRFNKHPRS
jgi:hypothetical protein